MGSGSYILSSRYIAKLCTYFLGNSTIPLHAVFEGVPPEAVLIFSAFRPQLQRRFWPYFGTKRAQLQKPAILS